MAARKWDVHKSEMERLYITEGKTLKELMQLMKTTHGFSATYGCLEHPEDQANVPVFNLMQEIPV